MRHEPDQLATFPRRMTSQAHRSVHGAEQAGKMAAKHQHLLDDWRVSRAKWSVRGRPDIEEGQACIGGGAVPMHEGVNGGGCVVQ